MLAERVDASEIIHGFVVEHAEQRRGLPWMTSAILSMHHLGRFEESALLAARKGADTIGFFVSPDGSAATLADEGTADEPITVSAPGTYDTLPEGFEFRPFDTKYPDAMVADFTKGFLRRMASGMNVTYHGLANDLAGVNYSSIRAGVIEERDQWTDAAELVHRIVSFHRFTRHGCSRRCWPASCACLPARRCRQRASTSSANTTGKADAGNG